MRTIDHFAARDYLALYDAAHILKPLVITTRTSSPHRQQRCRQRRRISSRASSIGRITHGQSRFAALKASRRDISLSARRAVAGFGARHYVSLDFYSPFQS